MVLKERWLEQVMMKSEKLESMQKKNITPNSSNEKKKSQKVCHAKQKGHFKRDENRYSGVLMQETNLEQAYTSQEI